MLVTTLYQKNGFLFTTEYNRKPVVFPLQELRRDMLRDPQWEDLNALEQVWQQGFLEHTPTVIFWCRGITTNWSLNYAEHSRFPKILRRFA